MKVYKVPQMSDTYVLGHGYYSYLGSELKVDTVECSNKLTLLCCDFSTSVYIDLENGNIVSGYRPGGLAFLLGNLFDFYEKRNYSLEKSNMIYWIEALSVGEVSWFQLGSKMAENSIAKSVLARNLMQNSSSLNSEFVAYTEDALLFNSIMRDAFIGRKSRIAELNMIARYDDGRYGYNHNTFILSYLRARNKDFATLYCRDDDSYYIKLANKLGIGSFSNGESIVKNLRQLNTLSNVEMTRILRNRDSTYCAELHDFMLDLEKMGQVLKNLI